MENADDWLGQKRIVSFRAAIIASERPQRKPPRSPTRGSSLAVFGRFVGASAAAGAERTMATRIGTPCVGAGGGGGMLPVRSTCCVTTFCGISVTLCADTVIPFLSPHASVSCPFTVNFVSLGILKDWFSPLSSLRITEFGGETCQTVPVTLSTLVMTLGVVVVMVCFSTSIPT